MKIGIITFWWSQCNYGQVLQAFSLQKFLNAQGHEAVIIRYDHRAEPTSVWYKLKRLLQIVFRGELLGFLKKRLGPAPADGENDTSRHFDRFRLEHCCLSEKFYNSFRSLQCDPPNMDYYVCGSDQIWNPDLWGTMAFNHAYMLDFADKSKCLALAPSLGIAEIPAKLRKRFLHSLKDFRFLSVREANAKSELEKCGLKNIVVSPDPTFLIDRQIFADLAHAAPAPAKDKYCFIYIIGRGNIDFPSEDLKRLAKAHNWEIVFSGSNDSYGFENRKFIMEEWLAAIRDAEFVVTNSFHGTAFSIIFRKNFANLNLTGSFHSLNTRIINLQEMLDIPSRYYSKESGFPLSSIDYIQVERKLTTVRNEFIDQFCSGLQRGESN